MKPQPRSPAIRKREGKEIIHLARKCEDSKINNTSAPCCCLPLLSKNVTDSIERPVWLIYFSPHAYSSLKKACAYVHAPWCGATCPHLSRYAYVMIDEEAAARLLHFCFRRFGGRGERRPRDLCQDRKQTHNQACGGEWLIVHTVGGGGFVYTHGMRYAKMELLQTWGQTILQSELSVCLPYFNLLRCISIWTGHPRFKVEHSWYLLLAFGKVQNVFRYCRIGTKDSEILMF